MSKAYVYVIRSDAPGTKIYVGKTINVERRWKGHQRDGRLHPDRGDLYADMNKIGVDQFRIEVVSEWETEEEAYDEEYKLIKEMQSSGVALYQKSKGYQCSTSEGLKGERNPFFGRKHSEETRAKLSEANKGRKNSLGRKPSDEARAKMSAAKKGRKHSEETIAKMRAARTNYWSKKRNCKASDEWFFDELDVIDA